jgi:hypothetical protein
MYYPFGYFPHHADNSSPSQHHTGMRRSQNIPIHPEGPVKRSFSEIQLCADQQIAEQRDYLFFSRVIHGIQQSMVEGQPYGKLQVENNLCLRHVFETRLDNETVVFNGSPPITTEVVPIGLVMPEEPNVGLPLDEEEDHPTTMSSLPHLIYRITSDALSLTQHADDCGMIFELDL